MKRLIIFSIAILIAFPAFCQEDNLKKLESLENNPATSTDTTFRQQKETRSKMKVQRDTVTVQVGNEIFSVQEDGDETKIKIGKKEYRIVEENDGVKIYRHSGDNYHRKSQDRFRAHLGGFEFGFDGLLTDFFSTSLKPEDSYFDLNTAKSYYFDFLLPSVNIGFTRHFGLAATLGINFNKYRFDGNNSITKGENGVIGPLYPPEGITYSKSKLATTYATLPVILEVQIPLSNPEKTINIGAGVIGAAKLGSHTKVVYYTGGKQKDKDKDDFSLNAFRWGATARIGYEFFQIYSTCYFTSMFEQAKGPELYPFEVGVAFTFNN
jgi:uncharacterized protein YdeI (BOF family)